MNNTNNNNIPQGVAAFEWPLSRDLWICYLKKFVARYGGRKVERARDLFEQVRAGRLEYWLIN